MSQRESEVNPENKHRYWKLHRIDFSERYYNVWGIITEFSFKKSYDSRYVEQDEFRFKIQMFISKPAVDVTIYSDVGLIPQSEFVIGRCIRLHRLSVAKFRATGSFYLRGRLNRPVSLLIVDVTDVKAEKVDVKYYSGDRKKLKLDVVDENVLFSFLAPLLTQMKKSKTSHVDDFDSSVNDDDYAAGTRVKIEAADDVEDEADGAAVIEQPNNDEGDARNTQNAAPTPVATDDVEDLVEQVAAEENARATIRTPRKVVEFVSPAAPQTPMRYSRDPRRRLLDREPSPDTPMRTPKAQPSQLTQRNVPPRSLDECIANYNGKKVVR
uniref:Uncharacterized protein n=1 Tax=Panagrolaimus sp. JU765 TaxID=591449 RepID=A0AC34R0Z2_9BILA